MKLNLGCGLAHKEDFVNVDSWAGCNPDVVCDLENEIWPFEDNSVDFVLFDHSLEHMGETTKQFFHVIKELYRVCKADAEIEINVPHPQNRLFTNDPTHVRAIYPETLGMFSLEINNRPNLKNSKLAMQCGVDFKVISISYIPDGRFQQLPGHILDEKLLSENNVAAEIHMRIIALK